MNHIEDMIKIGLIEKHRHLKWILKGNSLLFCIEVVMILYRCFFQNWLRYTIAALIFLISINILIYLYKLFITPFGAQLKGTRYWLALTSTCMSLILLLFYNSMEDCSLGE